MEKVNIIFTFLLSNGTSRDVTIKDVKVSANETEIVALGNKLIELRWQYKNSPFTELVKSRKLVITEEVF